MSVSTLARRTEVKISINGVDASDDINKYLLSFTYSDFEEDKTDDLRIELDDRDGIWLGNWLTEQSESGTSSADADSVTLNFAKGDIVEFSGGNHYISSDADIPAGGTRTAGPAKLTNIAETAKHPYHVIGGMYNDVEGASNVYGWVDKVQITGSGQQLTAENKSSGADENISGNIKGAEISAVIIQKNWESDGNDRVLDCGIFEIDSLDASGPPSSAAIKATSLPYSSTVRTEIKTRAWENIKLSAIANEIASKNSMNCMYESAFDPVYDRREQLQISDIVFLQGLCKDAGISLKISSNIIILFDEQNYEKKSAVCEIRRGTADVKSYRFGTSTNDTKYSRCRVVYTDPQTGQTIEYTYTPRDADEDGQTLDINEKVKTREEARQLAMKRLRQKNKAEYSAEFTLAGDLRLVAGVNIEIIGWGMFDGKYIAETAVHNVTASGHTTQLKLRRVLEEY